MFSERLRNLRKAKKLTQSEMAEKLGITRQGYGKYESGDSQPDFDTLLKLADFFGVSTDYLLGKDFITNFYVKYFERRKYLQKKQNEDHLTKLELEELEKLNIYLESDNDEYNLDEIRELDRLLALNTTKQNNDERDIAKRLDAFRNEIENSDGLAFSGEPLSEEAKESLIESMEHIFRQTQRINKKYIPKKHRDEEK